MPVTTFIIGPATLMPQKTCQVGGGLSRMENFKKFTLFIVVTIGVMFLMAWVLDSFGFHSPMFALLVNWLIMSWIALVGQVILLSFPSAYYDFRPFEQTGQIYERVDIRLFKKLVRRGPLTIFSPTLRFPREKTVPALQNLDSEMRKAETGHAHAHQRLSDNASAV